MCDEDSIQKKKHYERKVNVRFNRGFELASYLDKGNVPNMSYETLDSELQILNYKWKKQMIL